MTSKRHLPLRAKRDALLPVPLTRLIRAQRSLLLKWQTLHPRRNKSKKEYEFETDNLKYNQSSFRPLPSPSISQYVNKKELDFKRAKILAKPSWLLPSYLPTRKTSTSRVISTMTSDENVGCIHGKKKRRI